MAIKLEKILLSAGSVLLLGALCAFYGYIANDAIKRREMADYLINSLIAVPAMYELVNTAFDIINHANRD